ncbi:MAG: hypothetical protein F6K39_42175 [Okeania sp. SIO3B3]|nr:hypothetical protein [Okeania sp. SIO3B3]
MLHESSDRTSIRQLYRSVWQLWLFNYWTIVMALVVSDRCVWQLLFIYWTIVIALVVSDRFFWQL